MLQAPNRCPTCESHLGIRELGCSSCGTTVRGNWGPGPFQQLTADQQAFLILFVRSRGNLSEVERALGVSYPTVRAKLEELIQAMSDTAIAQNVEDTPTSSSRRDVLDRVARGEIPASEALEMLRRTQETDGQDD